MNKIINSDALEALRTLPDSCCRTCITSPPYYGLRDYGTDGQIGLEDTPDQYIENLVKIFREVRRVLKDDGTLWVNIGDSYAASGKGRNRDGVFNEKAENIQSARQKKSQIRRTIEGNGLKRKDLIGIPWLLAFALRSDGWYLRSDIIWQKPNAMPESVKDRPTRAHEYIFLLSKSPRYYYDAEAVKEPAVGFYNAAPAGSAGTENRTPEGAETPGHSGEAVPIPTIGHRITAPPWIGKATDSRQTKAEKETAAAFGQSPPGHIRAHTSPHSRRNLRGRAY